MFLIEIIKILTLILWISKHTKLIQHPLLQCFEWRMKIVCKLRWKSKLPAIILPINKILKTNIISLNFFVMKISSKLGNTMKTFLSSSMTVSQECGDLKWNLHKRIYYLFFKRTDKKRNSSILSKLEASFRVSQRLSNTFMLARSFTTTSN